MKTITISDISMKNGQLGGGGHLSFREKIELAKLLDRLGVSAVETGPIADARIDSLLIRSIASAMRGSALCVTVALADPQSPAAAWAAAKDAAHPRLQVAAPVSTVQMEYFCHQRPAELLAQIAAQVRACRALCEDVEFLAQDAGRGDPQFLMEALQAAADAGAGLVTVCDDAGTLLPEELGARMRELRAALPQGVRLGVQCSNALYLADACALAAVCAGAEEIKAAAAGDTATSLERFAQILKSKGAERGLACGVRTTEIRRIVSQIRRMCETRRSKSSPFDSGVRDGGDDTVLTVHDDIAGVTKAVARLGYDLSEEDAARVYEAFLRIASRKEQIGGRELDAIVASAAMQVPSTYRVGSYVINCGNVLSATCQIKLRKGEEILMGLGAGDGPIDAAFLAIEQIVGCHYELDDFQIQAVTEGREAMGETVVRLRRGGKLYAGRGISTDIIGASIRAYVSALNKIVYEEGEG